jgi:hypothetical protein
LAVICDGTACTHDVSPEGKCGTRVASTISSDAAQLHSAMARQQHNRCRFVELARECMLAQPIKNACLNL